MEADPTWPLPVGDEVRARASSIGPAKNAEPLPLIRFQDVMPSLHANDFVERLLVSGAMSVMYGDSNCGKTFLALDLALHVAEGRTWFGREITQGPALYLALEGGNGIRNRIVAYRSEHGLEDAAIPFFVVSQSLNLRDPAGDLAAIIKAADQIQGECGTASVLIVIDTLSRAMAGGNENAPEDMTALVAVGDQLRKATGAHCLWVHHSGKDATKGARGHSSLRAATDTEIEVIAEGNARRAEVRKQRDLDGGDVIRYSLKSVELGTNHRGTPVTSCVVQCADDDAEIRQDRARNLIGHNRRAYEVLCKTLVDEGQSGHTGVPDRLLSISDARWREQFYSSTMPGAEPDARKKAFRRAADALMERRLVAISAGRVWLISGDQSGQDSGT
jgi:AAA domain